MSITQNVLMAVVCGMVGIACALYGLLPSSKIFAATSIMWLISAYSTYEANKERE